MENNVKEQEREYVSFIIAPYCLPRLLLAMDNSDIKDFAITESDGYLEVRIPKDHLENIVYPHLRCKAENACSCKE